MRRIIISSVAAAAAILAGASFILLSRKEIQSPPVDKFAGQEIIIGGSESVLPVIGKKFADAYMAKHPQRKIISHAPSHTGGAIQGTAEGVLDLGFTSRPINKDEKAGYPSLIYHLPIKDGLVFATSKDVAVKGLSKQQILDIYSGRITNWQEVGGQDAEITVLDRTEESSPKVTLRKELKFFPEDFEITSSAIAIGRPDEMDQALETTSFAIGYTSFGTIKLKNLKVNVLSLDEIYPLAETIHSGVFPLYREMGFVTKGEPIGLLADFVSFIFSPEGRQIIESSGFVAAF